MTPSLQRVAGLCGLASVGLLVGNLSLTAEGPRPNRNAAAETARILADSDAIRLSAVLGVLGAITFAGFALALALMIRDQRPHAALGVAAAASIYCALALTSFAALAASAQAADTGLEAAAVMGFGHLHSTTLLIAFAPLGGVLIGLAASGLFGRVATWSAITVGSCAILSVLTLFSVKLDEGPFGAPLVVAFLGIPVWMLIISARLLWKPTRLHAAALHLKETSQRF